jgi:hypothetical protein
MALQQLRRREDYEAREAPSVPPSLLAIYWTATGALISACAALVLGAQAAAHLTAAWSVPILAVMTLIGFLGRRAKHLRLAADAWTTSSVVLLVLVVITLVVL